MKKFDLPTKDFYLNPVAWDYVNAFQPKKIIIGGRGSSKSFTNGISVAQKNHYMPRAIGSFLGETYTQILTATLLPMVNAWERLGFYRDIHYVIGKKPPSYFDHPYQKPERYDNVISWKWGHALILGSMDRPELLRGGSRDYNISDEALNLSEDAYKTIIIPTLRGSDIRLQGSPHHLNQEFTSSMPHHYSRGKWILEMQQQFEKYPDQVFYTEMTSFDNIRILGENVIRTWMQDMGKYAFAVECMNKRVRDMGTKFYAALSGSNFYPGEYNYSYIDNLAFNTDPDKGATINTPDSRWDKDCDPMKPLHISHDWGGRINVLTVDQVHESTNEVRFINALHVTPPEILQDLAGKFCEYYRYHPTKTVYQWGDKSGNKREANSKLTYFEQFADVLKSKGWRVIRKKIGDVEHTARYQFINTMLKGSDPTLPVIRINEANCKDLKISIENAPVKDLKKDKSSETSKVIKPQHATHFSDAFDYRLYHGFSQRSQRPRLGAGSLDIR